MFPKVPIKPPEGASDEESTYLLLGISLFESAEFKIVLMQQDKHQDALNPLTPPFLSGFQPDFCDFTAHRWR